AFTLAEVLITLGIIGVVAALTLPNLIANHQKKVTITRLKAAYQLFSEAIQKAQYDNGGSIDLSDEFLLIVQPQGHVSEISQLYIDPYIKGVEKYSGKTVYVKNKSLKNPYMVKYLNGYQAPMCIPNGLCYWVINHGANYRYITVDLNGVKGPNVAGRDVFVFDVSGKSLPYLGTRGLVLPHPKDLTEEQINNQCNSTSSNTWNGETCFSKIIKDGWEIKDDYPW
ncbi:MAG: hypothetical protein ACLSWI_05315, partial [Candidatus Gastranaerophilaceae bacterium]